MGTTLRGGFQQTWLDFKGIHILYPLVFISVLDCIFRFDRIGSDCIKIQLPNVFAGSYLGRYKTPNFTDGKSSVKIASKWYYVFTVTILAVVGSRGNIIPNPMCTNHFLHGGERGEGRLPNRTTGSSSLGLSIGFLQCRRSMKLSGSNFQRMSNVFP